MCANDLAIACVLCAYVCICVCVCVCVPASMRACMCEFVLVLVLGLGLGLLVLVLMVVIVHLLVLHVLDQGPGIDASERTSVLQRFKRGTSSAGTRGTGIGLALVDELMRAMDGELQIGDAPGGGADLQLRFRLAAAGR